MLQQPVQNFIYGSAKNQVMLAQKTFFLKAELFQHAARCDVFLVHISQQLAQIGFAENFFHQQPDRGCRNSLPMMRFRKTISNFAVAHGVADVLERNRTDHSFSIRCNEPAIALVLSEIREIVACHLQHFRNLVLSHLLEMIVPDGKRLISPLDKRLEKSRFIRKQLKGEQSLAPGSLYQVETGYCPMSEE